MHPNKLSGVGIGLRHPHFQDFVNDEPDVPWLEIHTENFFHVGSNACRYLDHIAEKYPLSAHCVGLSLGSVNVHCPKREVHLKKVVETVNRYQPLLVSDHLSWSASDDGYYLPDLLPLPYTEEAFQVMVDNIHYVQEKLGRQILIENPSSYLSYKDDAMTEWEFYTGLVKPTGCGLLLDINNIVVSAHNHAFDANQYLQSIPKDAVKEIHLAGYDTQTVEEKTLYIDTHGKPVYEEVWQLYRKAIEKLGPVPTLIEWDTDIPELSVLLQEKTKADAIIAEVKRS